jgi:hypothetical protein
VIHKVGVSPFDRVADLNRDVLRHEGKLGDLDSDHFRGSRSGGEEEKRRAEDGGAQLA